MPPEDLHPEKEQNETEGEIQLLEFLKNIQNYEEQMNDDSYKEEGIKFTRLNILSFSWALQLTEHLAKKHEEKAAPNDVDLTTLYLSKDLTKIYLRKEKSGEETFLKNEKSEKEIVQFQKETELFRRRFNAPYKQAEVQDMCGFIYVFYSIALVFELYFIEPEEFDPAEFINDLSLNHLPEHISPIIQRAITLYEEGELPTLKDVREWLEKSRFECQFNLIELLKSSDNGKRLRLYSTEKFHEKFNENLDNVIKGSYSRIYEVSYNEPTEENSGSLYLKKFNPKLDEKIELNHHNGRNIRLCFEFTHEFVSKTIGFIVDNHRITGILFEKLDRNFCEISKQDGSLTREILLELALVLSKILTKMHKMGIAYRDLKPDNIMVTKINADGSFSAEDIRLIDFDNATYLGQKSTAGTGTDYYRAPEVYIDRNDSLSRTLIEYNEKVDCYSLAMTLYYLMTKRLPYENWMSKKRDFRYTVDSITEHAVRNYYDYIRSYHNETKKPPDLEYDVGSYDDIIEIIDMGKHADPEKRSTMEEIQRAVEEKLKKLPE